MQKEAPPPIDPQKTETPEETLKRLNTSGVLSPASIESAINLKKSLEKLEEDGKIPPEVWDKEFVI